MQLVPVSKEYCLNPCFDGVEFESLFFVIVNRKLQFAVYFLRLLLNFFFLISDKEDV